MTPKLKRIKVTSETELRRWLTRNSDRTEDVMIVTSTKVSPTKHLSSDTVGELLDEFGWSKGRSFTLSGGLSGHVAKRAG